MGVSFKSLFPAFFKAPLEKKKKRKKEEGEEEEGGGGEEEGEEERKREKGRCIVSICVQHAKHSPKFLIS